MIVVLITACKRLARFLGAATILVVFGAIAGAQTTSTQDPLSLLRNLSQEQQQSLLQGVLGKDGQKSDSKLQTPETVDRSDRLGDLEKESRKGKTVDGRMLRAFNE